MGIRGVGNRVTNNDLRSVRPYSTDTRKNDACGVIDHRVQYKVEGEEKQECVDRQVGGVEVSRR